MSDPPTPTPPTGDNPYATPVASTAPVAQEAVPADWESIRRKHLSHEASLRAYGLIMLLGVAFLMLLIGISLYQIFIDEGVPLNSPSGLIGAAARAMLLGIIALYLFTGLALWQLHVLSRVGGTLVGLLQLLAFPVGTLLGAYLLYLVWSPKSQVIFSPRYREIRAATPHLRYQWMLAVWVVVLLAALSIAIVGAIMIA